jgi:hypothetical protein
MGGSGSGIEAEADVEAETDVEADAALSGDASAEALERCLPLADRVVALLTRLVR